MIKIYVCDISSLIERNDKSDVDITSIPKERLTKANRFKSIINYYQCIMGYKLLSYAFNVERIDISNNVMLYLECGKPYYESLFNFNITHSNNLVGVAISDNSIGIDIEMINHNEKVITNNTRLVMKYFNEEEQQYYNSLSNDEKILFFYRKWTEKECYAKRTGKGISKISLYINDKNKYTIIEKDKNGNNYFLSINSSQEINKDFVIKENIDIIYLK